MKALVYHGPGQRGWDTVDDPTIADAAHTGALKIVLNGTESTRSSEALVGAASAG